MTYKLPLTLEQVPELTKEDVLDILDNYTYKSEEVFLTKEHKDAYDEIRKLKKEIQEKWCNPSEKLAFAFRDKAKEYMEESDDEEDISEALMEMMNDAASTTQISDGLLYWHYNSYMDTHEADCFWEPSNC